MYDYLIVGAGISGAGAAYELALHGKVLLLEAEDMPGYHSTGRSAALFTRNYGNPVVRRINQASQPFFLNPPPGFCAGPLLAPRGLLTIAGPGNEAGLDAILDLSTSGNEIARVTAARACALAPLLRPERVAGAAYEAGVTDIDVASLHQAYLRGFRKRGGVLACAERIERLERVQGVWRAASAQTVHTGKVIVNAAGAWAGHIGDLAGAKSIAIIPRRRTAILVDAPPDLKIAQMPAVDFIGSQAYLKPDAGRIMASPGDESACAPGDAQPEELDIALVADWLDTETVIKVRRIASSWAGLRSFASDESPVVGYDPGIEGFFWLAGQGGYGIMMAPALARLTAALVLGGDLPRDLADTGLGADDLSPGRTLSQEHQLADAGKGRKAR